MWCNCFSFVLVTSRQLVFKIVRKFYLLHSAFSSCWGGDVNKPLNCLLSCIWFSYIIAISRDYILLISSCPVNEVKVGKIPTIASYTCNFFQNYFKGAKIWWLFAQLYKNPTDCFVLEVSTVSRFQNQNQYCKPRERK